MNSRFRQKAWMTGRFLHFLIRAGNRYRIHSPFLFRLVTEVIRTDKPARGGVQIEQIRNEYLNSREIVLKTDYGETTDNKPAVQYPVSFRRLARTSLTSPGHSRRLQRLAEFTGAERILEMGTSLGLTTAYLASANPRARVITLEGCPELSREARKNLMRLGLNNATVMEGRFDETLPLALKSLGSAGLVYIDGHHRKEAVMEYFSNCIPFANNDTVFVFDDIHSSPGMEQAWEAICQHESARITLDLFFSGWVFLRKESSREHFRLRYI